MNQNLNKVIVNYLSLKSMIKTSPNIERRDYAKRELVKCENELYLILDKEQDRDRSHLIETVLNN